MEIRSKPIVEETVPGPKTKPSGLSPKKIFDNETSEKGMHGEVLRPSEREDSNLPAEEPRKTSSTSEL